MRSKLSQLKTSVLGFFPIKSGQSPKGFTLVELLLAVAIIVIMSAFGIASFNSASRNSAVKSQAKELKTLIRKLRTDAGAAVKPAACTSGTLMGTYFYYNLSSDPRYGTVCFDLSDPANPIDLLIPPNVWTRPTGTSVFNGLGNHRIIFFGFDGAVLFYNGSATKFYPTYNEIVTKTGTLPPAPNGDLLLIRIRNNGVERYVRVNHNGLVCDEPPGTPTCASP